MKRFAVLAFFIVAFLLLPRVASAGVFTSYVLTTSPTGSSVYGQPVMMTITTDGGAATQGSGANFFACNSTITVQHQESLVDFQSCTPLGSQGYSAASGTMYSASVTSAIPLGTQYIYAFDYGPNGNVYAPATDSATQHVPFSVAPASTTTTLTSLTNPNTVNSATSLAAAVAVMSPGTRSAGGVGGSVTFREGSTTLCTGVSDSTYDDVAMADVYTCTAMFTTSGPHNLTATYSGTSSYNGSAGTLAQTVVAFASTTSVSATPSASNVGDSVTITATVTGADGVAPIGSVVFGDSSSGGSTILGTAALAPAGAAGISTATISTTALAAGTHTFVATFGGDSSHAVSSSSTTATVIPVASTVLVTLVPSTNSAVVGDVTYLNATLATTSASPLTGTISFMDGGAIIDIVTVSGNAASTSTSGLAVGLHALTAVYTDAQGSVSTSAVVTLNVSRANSTIALSSSSNPSSSGDATFTAIVTSNPPGNAIDGGSVTFSDDAGTLGTVNVDGAGRASISATHLASGTHPITATYSGNARVAGSSASLGQSVSATASADATVSLSASPNPASFGAAVTFTANVAVASGVPTGSVAVFANGVAVGSATLDAGGNASYTTTALPVGATTITVVFDGQGFYPSGSGTIVVTVDKGDSALSLASSKPSARVGDAVTFTATVSASSKTLTGTVEFFDGASSLGTADINGATASLTTTSLAAGSHDIKANYKGNSSVNASASSAITEVIAGASDGTSTSSSDDAGDVVPDVDAGGGSDLNLSVGNASTSDSSCASAPSGGTGGLATFALGLLGFALTRRRRKN